MNWCFLSWKEGRDRSTKRSRPGVLFRRPGWLHPDQDFQHDDGPRNVRDHRSLLERRSDLLSHRCGQFRVELSDHCCNHVSIWNMIKVLCAIGNWGAERFLIWVWGVEWGGEEEPFNFLGLYWKRV